MEDDDNSTRDDDRIRALELQHAEMFGRDGCGGRFATLEADVKAIKADVGDLKTFRTKALVLYAVLTVVGAFFAVVASAGLERLLGL